MISGGDLLLPARRDDWPLSGGRRRTQHHGVDLGVRAGGLEQSPAGRIVSASTITQQLPGLAPRAYYYKFVELRSPGSMALSGTKFSDYLNRASGHNLMAGDFGPDLLRNRLPRHLAELRSWRPRRPRHVKSWGRARQLLSRRIRVLARWPGVVSRSGRAAWQTLRAQSPYF
jgi:hypothetical protein